MLLAACLSALSACGSGSEPLISSPGEARTAAAGGGKVVLLGVDGMDWSVAGPMVERGELPQLRRLLREGARVPLESRSPMNSPALWTSIATGVARGEHGVLDFVYLPRGGARQLPISAVARTRLTFWEIFGFLDRPAATVGWFASWPPTPIHGILVTDRFGVVTRGTEGGPLTWPANLGGVGSRPAPASLEDLGAPIRAMLEADVPSADPVFRKGGATRDVLGYLSVDLLRARAAVTMAGIEGTRVTACYLQTCDALSHFFWKYREPGAGRYASPPDPAQEPRVRGIVERCYGMADRVLGALRDAAGPEAAVVLVSDHGFQAFVRPGSVLVRLDLLLERMGLLVRDSGGRVDVKRSAAFASEGTGIVEPLARRFLLVYHNPAAPDAPGLDDLVSMLEGLRTDGGRPLFAEVQPLHPAEAPGVDAPDVAVRIAPEALQDRAVRLPSGREVLLGPPLLYEFDDISGTHRLPAVLVVAGPGVPSGVSLNETARPEDVFAILLWLAGAPVPEDVTGRVPAGLRGPTSSPLRRVPSYEPWVRRETGPAVGTTDQEMLERLESLGYVDSGGESAP